MGGGATEGPERKSDRASARGLSKKRRKGRNEFQTNEQKPIKILNKNLRKKETRGGRRT